MTTYVYAARDVTGQALYIGCTNNLPRRMHEHRDMPWQRQAVVIEWLTFPSRREALEAEELCIRDERPRFNRVHNPDTAFCSAARIPTGQSA